MFSSQLRSWAMMVPRKRKDSTESTGESQGMMGAGGVGWVISKVHNSTVFRAFMLGQRQEGNPEADRQPGQVQMYFISLMRQVEKGEVT